MGRATELVDDLMSRPLSQKEIRKRREAIRPRANLLATSNGQLVEVTPPPVTTPQRVTRPAPQRVAHKAPSQTWD
jgi:hypothetical protein